MNLKDVEKPIASLEEIIKEFCVKNNLSQPLRKVDVGVGKVFCWKNGDLVLLTAKSDRIPGTLNLMPYTGGSGNHQYTSETTNYELIGISQGKEIYLSAEVIDTRDYEMKKNPNLDNCCRARAIATDKKERYIRRKDSHSYWFLISI